MRTDNEFAVSRIIENFVHHAMRENPTHYFYICTNERYVEVTLSTKQVVIVPYEAIEDNIIGCLDRLKEKYYQD